MSKRDAKIIQKAIGYCLLFLSVPTLATEGGFTEAQSRDPFSESRSTSDRSEYPSVLTEPDFESSVNNIVASPKPTVPSASPKKVTELKTPVRPVTSSALNTQKYAMVAPTYPTRALVLHENVLLSQALNQWAKDSGYKMLWNSNKDYMIYSTITYTGATTDDVLGDLGKLFSSENYGLVIKLYQKNKVLLVDEQ